MNNEPQPSEQPGSWPALIVLVLYAAFWISNVAIAYWCFGQSHSIFILVTCLLVFLLNMTWSPAMVLVERSLPLFRRSGE